MSRADRRNLGSLLITAPFAAVLLALVLLAAACGNDHDAAQNPKTSVVTSSTPDTTSKTADECAGKTSKLTFGVVSLTTTAYWDTLVARDTGIFEKHGLSMGFQSMQAGGTNLIAALTSGDVDIIAFTAQGLLDAAKAGAPFKMIAGSAYEAIALVASPQIKTYKDLVGKRIGVTDLVGTSTLSLLQLLKANGVAESDIQLIPLTGGQGDRLSSIRAGAVDATYLSTPQNFVAKADGFNSLGFTADVVGNVPQIFHAVNTEFAKNNPCAVAAYVKSLAEAQVFLRDPANRERAIQIGMAATKGSRESLEQTYDLFFSRDPGYMARGARFSDDEIQKLVDAIGKATGKSYAGAGEYFDWSYAANVKRR
ncbi:ABC transporter substrate-binding protein [Trinickia mobilis]|uniref:ABC transporter substrate-binding protein n=1 Tax=Trinickia mobilis TaxID=2816356 RepID=UPI001A8E1424|nr:ABC transporter substrate-binding protein [Trinickia mobilis]